MDTIETIPRSTRILYWLLKEIFPQRMLRLLFLSSLYSKIFKVELLQEDIYHKVNELLTVCERDDAIGMGMKLNKVIWNNIELGYIESQLVDGRVSLSAEAKSKIAHEIMRKTPSWLHYKSDLMLKDIGRLIDNRMQLMSIAQ